MLDVICRSCGKKFRTDSAEESPLHCIQCGAEKSTLICKQVYNLPVSSEFGAAKKLSPEFMEELRECFFADSTEIGVYIAIARQAEREGFPEIGAAFQRIALEHAESASRLADLIGEHFYANTWKNLEFMTGNEPASFRKKYALAEKAKEADCDEVFSVLQESSRNDARHIEMLLGLYKRFFL